MMKVLFLLIYLQTTTSEVTVEDGKTEGLIAATREPLSKKLIANWELSTAVFNTIKGSPGRDLLMFNGVQIRNGHAVLDGSHGYLDAGDFQGECFSDPEACLEGFTVQMTVKIYSKSVFASRPHFIMDSGAVQNNSRGMSLWVTRGYIYSMVVTREKTWCLHTMLYPYIEKWVSLTLTWGTELGLKMYINCQQFDQSSDHLSSECEKCEMCHQTDTYTRLMFGRPNTGPHYRVINMAVGEIAIYERVANEKDVDKICGKVQPTLPASTASSQQTSKKPLKVLKPKKDVDIALKVSYPTPRTRLRTRPTKHHTTPVKWPSPATEALTPRIKKKVQMKRPHLFASQNAAEIELAEPKGDTRSNVKTGASVKDLQLSDDEFPLLHFMEAENKASKAMKDPLHPSLDLIKNLKRR